MYDSAYSLSLGAGSHAFRTIFGKSLISNSVFEIRMICDDWAIDQANGDVRNTGGDPHQRHETRHVQRICGKRPNH